MSKYKPSRHEIITGFPSLGARETGLIDIYPYKFFIDLGSLLTITSDEPMITRCQDIVGWHREHVSGRWAWTIRDIEVKDDDVRDVHNLLWISFDLSEDAMLSRLTWLDLKGQAECSHLKSA